jgi:hypothetical protein
MWSLLIFLVKHENHIILIFYLKLKFTFGQDLFFVLIANTPTFGVTDNMIVNTLSIPNIFILRQIEELVC